jgi:hypothetical protein
MSFFLSYDAITLIRYNYLQQMEEEIAYTIFGISVSPIFGINF